VIVSRTDDIESHGAIIRVAITSAIPDTLPDERVLLPYKPTGNARTGLKKRSAAMCSWLFEITEEEIDGCIGVIPQSRLQVILDRIENHKKK